MGARSMTDVAFEFLSNQDKGVSFDCLWEEITKELGFNETQKLTKIGSFYESIMLDERFTSKDDIWDLSSRHKFAETHVDISAIEVDDSKDDDDLDYVEDDEELPLEKDSNEEDEVY